MKSLVAVILLFLFVVVGAEVSTDLVHVKGYESRVEATKVAYDSVSVDFSESLSEVEQDFAETFGKK